MYCVLHIYLLIVYVVDHVNRAWRDHGNTNKKPN